MLEELLQNILKEQKKQTELLIDIKNMLTNFPAVHKKNKMENELDEEYPF